MNTESKNTYWIEDDYAMAVSVNGKTTYYGDDVEIADVAAQMGLTTDDFEYLA